jgi:hypothetical protein
MAKLSKERWPLIIKFSRCKDNFSKANNKIIAEGSLCLMKALGEKN